MRLPKSICVASYLLPWALWSTPFLLQAPVVTRPFLSYVLSLCLVPVPVLHPHPGLATRRNSLL